MVTKPDVNGSVGTWGTILNAALDDLQSQVTTNGGNITTTNGNVTALTTRVTTAEGNITTLQSGGGFYSGTAAARAADTHYNTGGHYYETDTGRHWVGTSARWVPMPGSILFKARQTAAQSIPDATATAITLGTIDYDRLGVGLTGTGGINYTPGIPGWYELTGTVSFLANATGTRSAQWLVGGAAVAGSGTQFPAAVALGIAFPARAFAVLLTATDSVSLAAVQSSGASLNTASATSSLQAGMQVKYLGPA